MRPLPTSGRKPDCQPPLGILASAYSGYGEELTFPEPERNGKSGFVAIVYHWYASLSPSLVLSKISCSQAMTTEVAYSGLWIHIH